MMVSLILIYKNDLLSIKIEIYYQTIRVITKNMCNYWLINITNEVWFFYLALKIIAIKDLLILWVN